LRMDLYEQKSLGTNPLLGTVVVDLFTLATGPICHDLLVTDKDHNALGRLTFDLEMEHYTDIGIELKDLSGMELQNPSHPSSSLDPFLELTFSADPSKAAQHTQRLKDTSNPYFGDAKPIWCKVTLRDVINGHISIALKDDRAFGKNTTVAQYDLQLRSCFTFKEGHPVDFQGGLIHHSKKTTHHNVGFVKGLIIFRRQPQMGPMIGGIHTETGIREGRPLFHGVMLPKLIGDINAPGVVMQALPPGWEARVDSYGRTYYVDHNAKQTTWQSPLQQKVHLQENNGRRYSAPPPPPFLDNHLSPRRPTSPPLPVSPRPTWSSEDKAAAKIQNTFRRHRTLRQSRAGQHGAALPNPNAGIPLPQGWEERVAADGRLYYVDHIHQTTAWVHPLAQPIPSFRT